MTAAFMSSSELRYVGAGIRLQLMLRCVCSDKILGMDPQPPTANVNELAGTQDTGASLFAFLGDDARQVDAAQADAKFHQSPPILQSTERCEMAFKGRRDMVLFTTKRLIVVDVKGFSGTKTSFLSLPWSTVKCFGVKSAGSFLDKDSEMMIWCVRLCLLEGFRVFLRRAVERACEAPTWRHDCCIRTLLQGSEISVICHDSSSFSFSESVALSSLSSSLQNFGITSAGSLLNRACHEKGLSDFIRCATLNSPMQEVQ